MRESLYLLLVPHSKGSRIARLVETNNAESPTPIVLYNSPFPSWYKGRNQEGIKGLYIYTPEGIHRCFVFDEQFEFARFLECQNQSVK